MAHVFVVCLLVLAARVVLSAQDWPQFRGRHAGVAPDDSALPDTWSETHNVAWKIDIPGRGWSSPIVWREHVFVTTAINVRQPKQPLLATETYRGASTGGTMSRRDFVRDTDEFRWMLYDVDAVTGRVRWERVIYNGVPTRPVHLKNSYASETPVTDGERVYVYLGYVGLFAYQMDGTLAWARPMEARNTGNDGYFYGGGASPALHNGRVYVVNDNEQESFLAAFDTRTGAELWRVARDERSNWSTPYVWQNSVRTEVVTVGSRKVRSYDLDGKLLWELAVGTTLHTPTPFAHDGVLYVSSGYFSDSKRPVFAIRPGALGDISLGPEETANAFVLWSQPTASATYPSAIVVGDQYYTLLDRGFLTAHDAKTGTQIYGRQRIAVEAGAFSASPWSYNGKIFLLSEDGDTFVIQSGPRYQILGRNSLNEMSLASPAIVGGSVFIRTATKLYRIAKSTP